MCIIVHAHLHKPNSSGICRASFEPTWCMFRSSEGIFSTHNALRPVTVAPSVDPANMAQNLHRDNMILSLQLQIKELEQRIEKNVDSKLEKILEKLSIAHGPTDFDARTKACQTSREDLKLSQERYATISLNSNPTIALVQILPGLIEKMTNCVSQCAQNKIQRGSPTQGSTERGNNTRGNMRQVSDSGNSNNTPGRRRGGKRSGRQGSSNDNGQQ